MDVTQNQAVIMVVDALLNVRDLFYDSTLDNTRREFALIDK